MLEKVFFTISCHYFFFIRVASLYEADYVHANGLPAHRGKSNPYLLSCRVPDLRMPEAVAVVTLDDLVKK